MRTRQSILTHLIAATVGAVSLLALAAAPVSPQADPADPRAMQEAMERWMKTTRPGERHKFLEHLAGEWDTTTRVFMMPGTPPAETKGHASLKMIHGGRFLQEDSTGVMKLPSADGTMKDVPMTGLGLTGFDQARQLFTLVWTNNLSTATLTARGSLDREGKILTMFGEMDEPMTGEVGKTVRYTTRIISPDRHILEVHEVLYGEPFKVFEVEYTRVKATAQQ
jgi:hypothetical protein